MTPGEDAAWTSGRYWFWGGGVGGLVAASVLRRELAPEDRVVLLERAATPTVWPALLRLMSGSRKAEQVQRGREPPARRGIEVRHGEITEIDPKRRRVVVGGFYTVDGGKQVYDQASSRQSGHVAVVVADVPFKCSAAPYEAARPGDGDRLRRRARAYGRGWPRGLAGRGGVGPTARQRLPSEHEAHPGRRRGAASLL